MKKIISLLIRFVPRTYLQSVSGVALKVAQFFLRGDQTSCNVCGNKFRRFLPYGRLRARSNALCPGCLSLERHRLINLYLSDYTDFYKSQLSVLHIAPERCFLKVFRAQHLNGYVTADLDSPWADVQVDIHQMPFEDNRFDVVICNHVLEHVQDDLKALGEILRVLKKGGYAILQVPFFAPIPEKTFEDSAIIDTREREKVFGQSDHIRRYGKDYASRIESVGFKVIQENFAFELTSEFCKTHALIPETLFIGIKN